MQLDTPVGVDREVEIDYKPSENTVRWGRRLTIEPAAGKKIVFDASPGTDTIDALDRMEGFIDQVLAALAGR